MALKDQDRVIRAISKLIIRDINKLLVNPRLFLAMDIKVVDIEAVDIEVIRY